ncbi:hypothetical protein PRIPAC_81629, partial [Pristionchus pacificus]|uniref:Uncharacterized protein n=1 Tax=Pristionchus pacificus TaxID=54126 RepID=A0A2A6C2K0_PRIPA
MISSYFFGIIGASLNVALSILLCSQSMSRFAIFLICLNICALHGFFISQTILITTFSHMYLNGYYLHVFLWETVDIPQWVQNVWYVVGTSLITAMWQLTPAPCILQYLIMSNGLTNRRIRSKHSIIFIAYAPSIVMMMLSVIWAIDFIPTPAFELKIMNATRTFYNIPNNQTILVYGLSFDQDPINGNRSLNRSVMATIIGLTYFISYILFFWILYRVRILLAKSVMSGRILKLQRKFIKLQIVQCLFPLFVVAIPFSIFYIGVLFEGVEFIGQYQSIGFYAMPTVQSLFHIYFVKDSLRGKKKQPSNA